MVAQHVSQLHSPCQLSFTSLTFAVKTETLQFPCYVAPGLLLRWSMNINTSQHVSLPETWQIINLVADRHNMVSVCSHRLPKISRNIAQRYGYVLKPAQTQSSSYTDLQIPHKVHFLQLQKIFFFFFSFRVWLPWWLNEGNWSDFPYHTLFLSHETETEPQFSPTAQLHSRYLCTRPLILNNVRYWTVWHYKKKMSVCWREQCQEKNIFTKKKGGEWGRLPL